MHEQKSSTLYIFVDVITYVWNNLIVHIDHAHRFDITHVMAHNFKHWKPGANFSTDDIFKFSVSVFDSNTVVKHPTMSLVAEVMVRWHVNREFN